MLSSPLISALLNPLEPLPSFEGNENDPEMEEKELVDMSVSKINMSAIRHSPPIPVISFDGLKTSRQIEEPSPIPGSTASIPACLPLVSPSVHHGVKPTRPVARDKQPSYPDATSFQISSVWSLGLKTDVTK